MAVGEEHVFPGFLTPVLTQLSFQSHQLLFSHASAEVRDKNTPERKFASTVYQTHNHQVMSPTFLPLSHPGRTGRDGQAERLIPGNIHTVGAKLQVAVKYIQTLRAREATQAL